ncbi:arylamine N-acetyltransferase, pineal gland isozyme NAT-10-like [Solea senegalensis]|uniref:arylamine N-acetyltransferase n=1 Tax=Solea senegalensis TaxID=28829 RepID=A0AAV6Q7Z9_SOLSE|nr:arylamine N-acetyltransferase, pineal gland isozyme NAT-10-like [Solea senegalensis]
MFPTGCETTSTLPATHVPLFPQWDTHCPGTPRKSRSRKTRPLRRDPWRQKEDRRVIVLRKKMDLEGYFARIGFIGSYEELDLATLKQIHKQHVMSIPFENLSIHSGERNIIDLEVIYNKIVVSNRGGYCLENNLLFGWVLREMGYNTTTLSSRVFNSALNDFNVRESHLINKIVIDGKSYIADVSFGVSSQILEPLELISGEEQHGPTGIFRLIDEEGVWVLEKTCRKKVVRPEFAESTLIDRKQTKQIYCFDLTPREADYFFEINDILQTDPDSLFTNKSICSLQTPTGFRALIGLTYSEVTFKPEEGVDDVDMRDIAEDEIEKILKEKFNVKLKNKLKPRIGLNGLSISAEEVVEQPDNMNSLEQAEDLKAFERRLTEYVSCLQPATGRWRSK